MAPKSVSAFHTPGGDMEDIFKPLSVSLGAILESRVSPCSWLLCLVSTSNEAKGGRPYLVTKEKLFSMMMLSWMSYLGVWYLTIKFHRWQDTKMSTRKHNAKTIYIYIYIERKKIASELEWSHKIINVLACAWSECFAIASWYVLS